jgi:hypothetical protein
MNIRSANLSPSLLPDRANESMREANSILTKITSAPQAGTKSKVSLRLRQQSDKRSPLSARVFHKKRSVLRKDVSKEKLIAAKKTLTVKSVFSEFEGHRYCLRYETFRVQLELFRVQLELSSDQVCQLLERISSLRWHLDLRGVPIDIDRIWMAVRLMPDGGAK